MSDRIAESAAIVTRKGMNRMERDLEFVYQAYRMQFSEAYFSGSEVNVGKSFVTAAREGHPRANDVLEFLIRLRTSTPKRWSVLNEEN